MASQPLERFHQAEDLSARIADLGLTGFETYEILGLDDTLTPRATLTVQATASDGSVKSFSVRLPLKWQDWQFGSCSQPTRAGLPTLLMFPWQLWQPMAAVPSGFRALPMAPRRRGR
mgnify:CR=1 FL=1